MACQELTLTSSRQQGAGVAVAVIQSCSCSLLLLLICSCLRCTVPSPTCCSTTTLSALLGMVVLLLRGIMGGKCSLLIQYSIFLKFGGDLFLYIPLPAFESFLLPSHLVSDPLSIIRAVVSSLFQRHWGTDSGTAVVMGVQGWHHPSSPCWALPVLWWCQPRLKAETEAVAAASLVWMCKMR